MISLCACQETPVKKSTLQVFADSSLDKKLQLVGDKFQVTDGKEYDIQYTFDTPEKLLEKIHTGEPCDLLLTSSETLLDQLRDGDFISADNTKELLQSPLAMITSSEYPSIPLDVQSLFYEADYGEEGDYYEDDVIEGYRPYADVLWEVATEEEWQDDWNGLYEGLWIMESVPTIGIITTEQKEGQAAKSYLNQDRLAFDLLNQIGKIRSYDSKDSLLDAIRNREVQIGFCSFPSMFDEKNIQALKIYDGSAPTVSFYVSLLNGSESRKDAKVFMNFLQGDHARRFFEDFGFYMR